MILNNILPTKNVTDQYSNDVYELQILGNTRILCYKYLRLKSCDSTEKLQHMEWQPQWHLQKKTKTKKRKEKKNETSNWMPEGGDQSTCMAQRNLLL